jgi:hypothetical protein
MRAYRAAGHPHGRGLPVRAEWAAGTPTETLASLPLGAKSATLGLIVIFVVADDLRAAKDKGAADEQQGGLLRDRDA